MHVGAGSQAAIEAAVIAVGWLAVHCEKEMGEANPIIGCSSHVSSLAVSDTTKLYILEPKPAPAPQLAGAHHSFDVQATNGLLPPGNG